jgi:hypothetical protein
MNNLILQEIIDKITGVTTVHCGDLNSSVYYQEMRDAILGVSGLKLGSLNEVIYLQQVRNAILGVPDGQFGNLPARVYLQEIRDAFSGITARKEGVLDDGIYLREINGVAHTTAATTYTISGTVYDADGSTAVVGATVALGALSAISGADGTYTISIIPSGTSGSMTCTKTGKAFAAITIAAMSGNLTSQNYTAEIDTTCPTITPTLGSELLTNPDFEGAFTDGLGASWSKSGTPTVTQETTTKHGGSNSQKVVGDAGGVYNTSGGGTTIGTLYRLSAFVYVEAGTARMDTADNTNISAGGLSATTTSAAWIELLITGRSRKTTSDGPFVKAVAAGTTYYVDDASKKSITLSTCLSLLGAIARQDTVYACHPTLGIGPQAGIVVNYLDANNFVLALIDRARGKAELLKRTGSGTWTSLIDAAFTYSAGAELKIVVSGTTYQLWYNGAQIGINQTVSDSLGTGFYGFATDASAAVGVVTTNPT